MPQPKPRVLSMIYFRVRLRFRKRDDIRWISHHDLVRTFERWLRRAGLPLRRSEGFHPKPKLSFPSALALGIAALDEVLEFELTEPLELVELRRRLERTALPGLEAAEILSVSRADAKPQIQRVTYELPIPPAYGPRLVEQIAQLQAVSAYWFQRVGADEPADLKASLDQLEFHDGKLRFCLAVGQPRCARPREVLEALGVAQLESAGCCLTRTRVELAVRPHNSNEERRNKSHEEGNADQCVATGGMPDRDR
jgi:radical SAM-linked protein